MATLDSLDPLRQELIRAANEGFATFVAAMERHGYSPADQLWALGQVHAVQAGSAHNGYTMAKARGHEREAARAHPATSVLLEIANYLGAEAPRYDEILAPPAEDADDPGTLLR